MRHDILSIVLLAILATTLINACLLLFMTDYAEKKSELQHIFLIMDSPGEGGGATAPCLTFLEISRRADVTY